MKKLLIALLLFSGIAQGQVRDFITKYGVIVQMRTYDSTAIANAINLRLLKTDSASPIGYASRWRTQHLIDSLSSAFGNGVTDGDKGDITVSGSGSIWTIDNLSITSAKIANDAVTYAKLQNISATSRFLGRITASAGDAEELTGTQATSLLDVFTTSVKGLVPAATGGNTTTQFLRKDGTWVVPTGSSGVTGIDPINSQTKSANGAVVNGSNLVLQTVDGTYPGLMTSASKARLDSNFYIITPVTGVQNAYQLNDSTLRIKSLVQGTNIAITNNGDTTNTIDITGIIASSNGGTGNGFTKFTGPTTSEKIFTLPNASSTLLYSGGALGTPSSGNASNLTSFPTLNQNTTGSAASLLNPRTISGTGDATFVTSSFDGTANVSGAVTVVKINGTTLSSLGTGLLKNTTGTGVPSIAVNSDLPVMSATVGGAVPTPPNDAAKFLNGAGAFTVPAGSGDMVLASVQTVTGAKTFNDTKFLLRNVANTFNGSFVNTNTADRIYTLKDAAGTIAFTSDITGTNSGTNTGDNAVNSLYSGLVSNANHTGDATGSTALTLATVNSNVGSFGSATQAGTFTVNAKGLITAASNTTIAIPESAVTNLTTDLAAKAPLVSPSFTTPNINAATGTSLALSSFLNEAKGADIASATTTDIGAATGNYADVTGTVTITGLGTVQAGTKRTVRFTGALTLTHSGTALILPGAVNITTVAGDVAEFISLGSGNWRCTNYFATRNIQGIAFSGAANIDIINGTGFVKATGTTLSYDNSTYLTTASAASTYQPLDGDLTTIAGLTATTDNFIVSNASAWASRTPAQARASLALVPGTDIEVHDADLTTIAGLTATTDNFMVSSASAWASRTPAQAKTSLSLNNVENTALSTWAGSANVLTLGIIGTGTWQATTINQAYLGSGGGGSSKFLREDNTWQTIAGGGDMVLASVQSVTGKKTFDKDKFAMKGTSTGVTNYSTANTSATDYNFTTPAVDITAAQLTDLTTSTSAATASTLVKRDANANVAHNNVLSGYTTTATAAGTTTLTVGSTQLQYFTGVTTQTVTMPVASTLVLGQAWEIDNLSTGLVTVQSSGSNAIIILAANTSAVITCILTSGTGTASWSTWYGGDIVASGKKLNVSNSLTLAGTDATVMTFPTTSATIARIDALQTFTGVNTFSSTIVGSVNGNAATVTTNANLTGDVISSGNATTIAAPSETAVDNNTGGWVVKKVSGSDVTTTGQTLVDVTGLVSGTLSASSTYEVQGMLIVTTSTGANGTEYGLNCTGTGADQSINWVGPSTETAGVQVLNEVGTGNNNVAATPAFLTTASMAGCIWFHGYVTTGTGSPTMAIRHLKATSGTSTIKISSRFEYRKL